MLQSVCDVFCTVIFCLKEHQHTIVVLYLLYINTAMDLQHCCNVFATVLQLLCSNTL